MLNAVVGSFALTGSTGNQTVTGLGFTPQVVLFWFAAPQTADGSAATANIGFGVGISSSNRRCIFQRSGDSISTTIVDAYQRQDCVLVSGATGVVSEKIDLVSLNNGGFTVNVITNASAIASIVNYLALGGSDLTGVASGSTTLPTTPTTASVTGLGFQPTAVILFASTVTTADPLTAEGSSGGFLGWAVQGGAQVYNSFYSKDAVTTSVTASGNQTTACATLTTGTTVSAQATLQSFNSGGFTLNWTTVTGSADVIYYIALAGPSFESGTLAQPTSNGVQTITGLTNAAGLAFVPSCVIFKGADAVAQVPTAGNSWSLGIADNQGNQGHVWVGDANGLTTTNSSRNLDRTVCIKNMTVGHASPTVNSSAVYQGATGTNGFNINWTATDGTARITQFLAIGAIPASPGQAWLM
jgi:hypothetical protein